MLVYYLFFFGINSEIFLQRYDLNRLFVLLIEIVHHKSYFVWLNYPGIWIIQYWTDHLNKTVNKLVFRNLTYTKISNRSFTLLYNWCLLSNCIYKSFNLGFHSCCDLLDFSLHHLLFNASDDLTHFNMSDTPSLLLLIWVDHKLIQHLDFIES